MRNRNPDGPTQPSFEIEASLNQSPEALQARVAEAREKRAFQVERRHGDQVKMRLTPEAIAALRTSGRGSELQIAEARQKVFRAGQTTLQRLPPLHRDSPLSPEDDPTKIFTAPDFGTPQSPAQPQAPQPKNKKRWWQKK